jgi:hypothetical protein
MWKFLILLLLVPLLLEAQQDTILVHKGGKIIESIYPMPGTWKVYHHNGKIETFPNATLKVQKITVPVKEDNSGSLTETKVFPQPFNNSINIEFESLNNNNVDFDIYNQSGQIVFNSSNNFMLKGKNTFSWDGKDNQGNKVQSGTYFLITKQGTSLITEKLLLIK